MLLFKVDFEKAFDSVNWEFLFDIMVQMNFGSKLRKWISSCLSSVSVLVLINESPSKEFKMERGLKQGDPLSPFLFLIIAEVLQVMIIESCNKGIFKGLSLDDDGSNISLLQFTDDALFFGEWSKSNVRNLIHILDCFHDVSGLKINLDKSRLFGIEVSPEEVFSIKRSVNCSHGRLSSWKANMLSIGGRLTLVKSVLGSLPLYYLSLFKAPTSVNFTLESIRRRFFWGFKDNEKKMVWVSWQKIMSSTKNGGALWRRVIVELHGVNGGFDQTTHQGRNFGTWVNIVRSCFDLEQMGVDLDKFILYALETSKDCVVADRWVLEDGVWHAKWAWRRHPTGRASRELDLLVPRVLVTCRSQQLEVEGDGNENVPLYYFITDNIQIQFGREEFFLVTGLRFGVENLADYNDRELPIPYRRRVFPSCYDGEHITCYTILEIIEDEVLDRLHDEDAVSLCCLGILQLVLLGVKAKYRIPDWMLRLANDRVGWDNYPWGSFVWPTLYSQLKNENIKR
ncbi:reverse transcriptase domain, reverse transcriptase zinc-binding domain protein [Tanacetum coccineum]